MPTSLADELCSMTVGAAGFVLALSDARITQRARTAVSVTVNYDACEPEDAVLPLELIITGPSPSSFKRRIFRRALPSAFDFTPVEGGTHQVMLRETWHNRWIGVLSVNVAGEELGA